MPVMDGDESSRKMRELTITLDYCNFSLEKNELDEDVKKMALMKP